MCFGFQQLPKLLRLAEVVPHGFVFFKGDQAEKGVWREGSWQLTDNYIEFTFASNAHFGNKTRKFVQNKYGMYATCDHIDVAHCKFLKPFSDSPLATNSSPRQAP